MSAEPVHAPLMSAGEPTGPVVREVPDVGPFAGTPSEVLADSLEAQYSEGEAMNPLMVGEVLGRLLDAERELAALRPPR